MDSIEKTVDSSGCTSKVQACEPELLHSCRSVATASRLERAGFGLARARGRGAGRGEGGSKWTDGTGPHWTEQTNGQKQWVQTR